MSTIRVGERVVRVDGGAGYRGRRGLVLEVGTRVWVSWEQEPDGRQIERRLRTHVSAKSLRVLSDFDGCLDLDALGPLGPPNGSTLSVEEVGHG